MFASDDQEQPCKMNIILAQMRIPFRQHTLFPFYVKHYVVVSSQEREERMGEKRDHWRSRMGALCKAVRCP